MSNARHRSQSHRDNGRYNWDNFREQALRAVDNMDRQSAWKKFATVGSAYPFTTTLTVTFGVLSLFPVLTFLVLSFFASLLFLLLGLATALGLTGTIIPGSLKILGNSPLIHDIQTLTVAFGPLSFFPVLTLLVIFFLTPLLYLLSGLATALVLTGIVILGAFVMLLSIISLIFGFALFFS
ncbi:unnamed protein product, partial [Rhizoctonia solani]